MFLFGAWIVVLLITFHMINVYSPASYKQPQTADIVPIKFINKKPFVEAGITMEGRDPILGTFEIDTGGEGVMFVYRPFVEARRLLKSVRGFRPGNVGGAAGGLSVEDDMSGLDLMTEGENLKTLTINEVLANSPAGEAGLREEDELRAIDGRPVSELGLEEIRQMFKQEGKEYLLSIKRGEQPLQVKIKLRRMI